MSQFDIYTHNLEFQIQFPDNLSAEKDEEIFKKISNADYSKFKIKIGGNLTKPFNAAGTMNIGFNLLCPIEKLNIGELKKYMYHLINSCLFETEKCRKQS